MDAIETHELIDTLILERAKYVLITKHDLHTAFGKFFKVNNVLNGAELILTLVIEEVTGKYIDIPVNDILSIEILKTHKKFKVLP